MIVPITALLVGIVFLVISADKFVEGAAATAKRFGLPPLLIGMIVIGFGSSVPEMLISTLSAYGGNPGLALGNAFGSNISNIALILGVAAVLSPITVASRALHRELPYLAGVTVLVSLLLYLDGKLSRQDGMILVVVFSAIMLIAISEALRSESDPLAKNITQALEAPLSLKVALTYTTLGLIFLVLSSRILVWGGVEIAQALGISDLVIGLTIVAIGTSLPELASAIVAVRKNEYDLALGNVIGSNIFNTTVVIGIAGILAPSTLEEDILLRDIPMMAILTIALFVMGYRFKGQSLGRINRLEGSMLLLVYLTYNLGIVYTTLR